ncbi:MAG: hypothetical protein LBV74_00570 [Tannerella sp.]|jgi:hypothetical protein|nr:hypothetical protein [Tannerella sp.]
MKIEEFISNPIESFIKAERYVNDGSRSNINNTTSENTRPLSGTISFAAKIFRFNDKVTVEEFGNMPCWSIPKDCIVVHPDMVENEFISPNISEKPLDIIVVPTASGRTVFNLTNKTFIKLAYTEILGRIPRHMTKEKIQSSCEVTNILKRIIDENKVNQRFSIFREDYGKIAYLPLGNVMYELGVLFRESSPYPYIDECESLIPFFSLFSKEYIPGTDRTPCIEQDEPLIIQLFKKQTLPLAVFLIDNILKPLFHTYFDALIFGGIELEAHAQNMLLTINKDFQIKRIVCRDLESAGRDIPLMQHFNIQYNDIASGYKYNTHKIKNCGEKYDSYHRTHSFMFDFKLGEYIVSPIINCICNYNNDVDRDNLLTQIKDFNQQFINKLPSGFFPPEWCDYEDRVWNEGEKKEYNWHKNPKYRHVQGDV